MQDRFKFRCFNKFQNKIYDVKSISYIDGIVKRIEVQDEERILIFDEWMNNIDNTVLIQCTGLKDKNGKLIYEGDVVKDLTYLHEVKYVCAFLPIFGGLGLISHQDLKDYKFCKENWEDYKINDNVRRFDNRFKLANQGNKLHCFNMLEDRISDYEIVGNIYENPELLENKQ